MRFLREGSGLKAQEGLTTAAGVTKLHYMADRGRVITIQTSDLMRVGEAASELGRPPLTIYRWVERGKLLAVKFDGILYVPRSEVERIKAAEADQAK